MGRAKSKSGESRSQRWWVLLTNPGALPQASDETAPLALKQMRPRKHRYSVALASSTARLIAAIMLSGRAMPLPAISNAVP